ncbi:MAG: recombinase RecA [Candidatus Babeliaceae bacterium]|nr:recombinase RecA [Candidatus Babeliaceae bacterium]
MTTTEKKGIGDLALKKKALEATFAHIDKQYGKGSVMVLGQSPSVSVDAIPTGSLLVDWAIGVNGLPRGRVVEIYGPEASGKTTIALQAIAQAQKRGGICAFIDAEHALDPQYAQRLGIKVNDLIISQPDYGEQALDIAEMLIRSAAIDIVVVDSVAALVPKAELDGDMGDAHVGLQARLMSQALRKLTPVVHKSKTVLVFINQVRQNISAMAFGPRETTTGGKALKFYASLRLDVRRIETLKDKNGVERGNRVQIKVAKNKVAPPFKTVTVELIFGEGVSEASDLLDAALSRGVVLQSGAWFSFEGGKIGQGREAVCAALKENGDLAERLRNKVLEVYAAGRVKGVERSSEGTE